MPDELRISVRDLREHTADHIRHVSGGGSVLVTSRGRPVARLVPVDPVQPIERPFGFMKGRIRVAPDFDDTPPDILEAIEKDLVSVRGKARH